MSRVRMMKLMYLMLMVLSFCLCWNLYYSSFFNVGVGYASELLFSLIYTIIFITLMRIYGGFEVETARLTVRFYSQMLADILSIGILYVIVCICWIKLANPLPLIVLLILQGIVSWIWNWLADKTFVKVNRPQKTIIIYRNIADLRRIQEIHRFSNQFNVQAKIEFKEGNFRDILDRIEGFEVIFVAGVPATLRNAIAKFCVESSVKGYFVPHVGDVIMLGAEYMSSMFSVPVMKVQRVVLKPEYAVVKRLMDIVLSLIAIIISSPFMLVTALAIKIYDRGPVIYRQVRLTKDSKQFNILKFRSMKVNAEKDGVARLAAENDDRITPVGKVIRACRLDELPQLFNILKGDMSIVGPRPERPEIAQQYEEEMPAFSLRLQVKAGLTGLAQVYGRYNTEPYNKLQMDLMYINRLSLWEDIRLILATVKILFMKESTEGIKSGMVTAIDERKEDNLIEKMG